MNLVNHQAKYFAYDLTRQGRDGLDRLSMALFDAAVDLNPHQIEAALFSLQSPLSRGVILCDEVGLGKTIEAGIVLCQLWAEGKKRLLVLTPASIRKQWAMELEEKFNLPTFILDSKSYRDEIKKEEYPLEKASIIIISYHYANRIRDELKAVGWDLVVIDEAHKLRNAYRPSNKLGQGIRWATEGCRKLLLTATPLQNSLLELYGLSTLIDEHIFGDLNAFKSNFVGSAGDISSLRRRLKDFSKRTLRKQVTEYIQYTERRPVTFPFSPSDDEHKLYEAISEFLKREDLFAIPNRQKHLIRLILHKLLASSTVAIAATLEKLKWRLETMLERRGDEESGETPLAEELIESEELESDLLEEILDENGDQKPQRPEPAPPLDRQKIMAEVAELNRLIDWARSIKTDTKTRTLLVALENGFDRMSSLGAEKKALIFTESRRTQEYLKEFLDNNGYRGKVVLFNGTNRGPESAKIYENWLSKNSACTNTKTSKQVNFRTALIEHFRDKAQIMIATEAGAEGINLQFCSLVINYDLPWNPQRIEQRIGRCHRYGQKHDVVVINFLNERNAVDKRVLELLSEKFRLFEGIFGASDDVLGAVESGVDFEKRILSIYQKCRTEAEIEEAFKKLQEELDEQIRARLADTRRILLEHFDEDVHSRLKLQLETAQSNLDKFGKRFWAVTKHVLRENAEFNDETLTFSLTRSPTSKAPIGIYHLISKENSKTDHGFGGSVPDSFLYRLSHPLGEYVIATAKSCDTPAARIEFDITSHPTRISLVEQLKGEEGWLILSRLIIDSYEREEYLLFSAFKDDGGAVSHEVCEKLFMCGANMLTSVDVPDRVMEKLNAEMSRHIDATISRSLEHNNVHFQKAREKLEQWADDMVLAAEKALKDTKEQIKILRRKARQAETLDEQHDIQVKLKQLERQQRRQRREIFEVEDEIMEKRDELIDQLEKRMNQRTHSETLFVINWSVV